MAALSFLSHDRWSIAWLVKILKRKLFFLFVPDWIFLYLCPTCTEFHTVGMSGITGMHCALPKTAYLSELISNNKHGPAFILESEAKLTQSKCTGR